ncbi:MAG: hypothetical protein ACOCXT_01010 [Candidatus Dojkabacteria bacterium]
MKNSASQKKYNLGKALVASGVLVVPLILALTVSSAMAFNSTDANPAAAIGNLLPLKEIPVLNEMTKSDLQTFGDMIARETDPDLMDEITSRKYTSETQTVVTFRQAGAKADETLTITTKGSTEITKSDQMKTEITVGGMYNNGIITMNAGDDALKMDLLQVSQDRGYLRYDMSDGTEQTLELYKMLPNQQFGGLIDSIKAHENQYILMDRESLDATMGDSIEVFDLQEALNDVNKKYEAELDLLVEQNFIDTIENYTTITNQGTETVHGQETDVLSIDINEEELAQVTNNYLKDLEKFYQDHKDEYIQVCRQAELEEQYCDTLFMSEFSRTNNNLQELFEESGRATEVKTLIVYISQEDSSLLRTESELVVSGQNIDEELQKEMGVDIQQVTMQLNMEETERGQEVNIEEPEEYLTLDEILSPSSQDNTRPTLLEPREQNQRGNQERPDNTRSQEETSKEVIDMYEYLFQ